MILEAATRPYGAPPPPPAPMVPAPRREVREHLQADALPRANAARERLARATVLIVDDEPANVRLLTRFLERSGCEDVIATTSAAEGVRLYAENRPDLML